MRKTILSILGLLVVIGTTWLAMRARPVGPLSGDLKEIHASGPAECEPGQETGEWSWSISQIPDESLAPANITVRWTDGEESVPFRTLTGQNVAKYLTNSHADQADYLGATAWIYAEWQGAFTISHPPCSGEGITPTATLIPEDTSTPVPTATETGISPTLTDTPVLPGESPTTTLPPKEVTPTPTSFSTSPTPEAGLPPPGPGQTQALLPVTGGAGRDETRLQLLYSLAFLAGIGLVLVGFSLRRRRS